jgi:transcriptional regulator with XRE-family HTH domain
MGGATMNQLLRNARRKKGWSQQQLADFAGLSLSTIQRAERGKPIRIDSIQRICECFQQTPEQLGLIRSNEKDQNSSEVPHKLQQKQPDNILCSDYLSILENDIKSRWSLYHTGGANLAYQGLDLLLDHITKCMYTLKGDDLYPKVLTLLSMGYQLQGSILRDLTRYTAAHIAHRKALLIAQKLFDPELISAALVREGITLNQQELPVEAITYFERALETIKYLGYSTLEGYILQALSEAQAKARQSQASWKSINLAEEILEKRKSTPERSLTRFNQASLTAQKGVNAIRSVDYPIFSNRHRRVESN